MELNTLLRELDVLNVALEESKRQTAKLEQQMKTLQESMDFSILKILCLRR